MPTIYRESGCRFYFFSHEPNEPPHVHIDKGDATWLASLEIAKNPGFRAHEISGMVNMVGAHQVMCTEKWHEYFG